MELTWIAIVASLLMGSAGLLVFVWAVHRNQFRNIEDVKYQVFWSEVEDRLGEPVEQHDADGNRES